MSDDTDSWRDRCSGLSTATALALLVLIWAVVGVGGAAVLSSGANYDGPLTVSGPGGDPNVTITGSGQIALQDIQSGADGVELATSNGNVTVNGTGATRLTLSTEWTNATNLRVDGDPLTIDAEETQSVRVAGQTDTLNVTTMVINDNETDFVYAGTGGQTSLTIYDLPKNVELRAVDDDGTVLGRDTTGNDGQATFVLDNSQHNVSLQSQNISSIAPFWPNVSQPNTSQWTNGSQNATLSNLLGWIGRAPSLAVGGQGLGAVGTIIVGLLVMGVTVVGISPAGPVAGAVAGVSVIGVVTGLGLAPQWLFAVVLFGLGAVATAVVIRAWS